MTILHMLSLAVDLRELRRFSVVSGLEGDEGRSLHHLLCETFGKGVTQPFRLMPGRNGARAATLYSYSYASEQDLRRAARETGLPESARVFALDSLAVKTMPAAWTVGRRLAFDVRVRPVRRLKTDLHGWSREAARARPASRAEPISAGSEVDAFVVARIRANPEGTAEAELLSREEVYRAWLGERFAPGAALDLSRTRLVRHERSVALRGGQRVEGPEATMHGELTIEKPMAFAELLARGAGRHTAYGYGMVLLRPARG